MLPSDHPDFFDPDEDDELWFAERDRKRRRLALVALVVVVAMLAVYVLSNVITQWNRRDQGPSPTSVVEVSRDRSQFTWTMRPW